MPAPPYRGLLRTTRVPPCVVSLEDLRRLYADLSGKSKQALEQHLDGLPRPQHVAAEDFANLKAQALEEGGLTVTVQGADGEQVAASSSEGLAADVLPDRINWIAFDSAAAMQRHNLVPLNRLTLRLDFTEPPGFDTYNPWDEPTPNTSELQVIGNDATWVTGVYESTLAFFRKRSRRRLWLHTHQAFNALNWLFGFPAALWVAYRLGGVMPSLASVHTALQGAFYVYVFLLALLLFRGMIWAGRWMFPVIELEGARSKQARTAIGAVIGSIILALVYDVLKTLFWPASGGG